MIRDNGSLPRKADKYLTSYMLKMIFFKNVEDFRQADLELGEMVCKVYDDLEQSLSDGFIPLFFLPKVSALSGINIDISKSRQVAAIMKRFVRALHERDCRMRATGGTGGGGDVDLQTTGVYRIYDIT